jgi:hypothetical protein
MSKTKESITFGKRPSQKGAKRPLLPRLLSHASLKLAILATLVVGLAAGLVIAGVWTFRGMQQKRVDDAMQAGTKLVETTRPEGVAEEAQAQAWKGDIDGADSKLQAAIATATSKEEKHRLLVERAVIALNNNQQQKALDIITEAEKYGASKASSDAGALAAEEAKNRPLAVVYYNKSIERIDKSHPLYESEVENIKEKIAKLEQQ